MVPDMLNKNHAKKANTALPIKMVAVIVLKLALPWPQTMSGSGPSMCT